MLLAQTSKIDSVAQFLTVLVLFLIVLAATWFTTRFIAGYQKGKLKGQNFEIIDSFRLTQTKYVQIMRIGNRYLALAICKDTVTVLCELEESEVLRTDDFTDKKPISFEDFLEKAKNIATKSPSEEINHGEDDEES